MTPQYDRIFGFRVIEQLGSGARTAIYRAQNKRGEELALKHLVVRSKADKRCLMQMRREHSVAQQLAHPGIRNTHRLRVRRGPFRVSEAVLIMELVNGESLDKAETRSLQETMNLMLQIAEALASMHRAGWVHGDLKPTNLVVSQDDIALIDLGQAARAGSKKERVQGTPGFMAPEQLHRGEITPRTDIFGFGATLYWALTRSHIPTVIDSDRSERGAVASQRLGRPPGPVPLSERRKDVPPELSALVNRCVAYEPRNRPAGFSAILGALASINYPKE